MELIELTKLVNVRAFHLYDISARFVQGLADKTLIGMIHDALLALTDYFGRSTAKDGILGNDARIILGYQCIGGCYDGVVGCLGSLLDEGVAAKPVEVADVDGRRVLLDLLGFHIDHVVHVAIGKLRGIAYGDVFANLKTLADIDHYVVAQYIIAVEHDRATICKPCAMIEKGSAMDFHHSHIVDDGAGVCRIAAVDADFPDAAPQRTLEFYLAQVVYLRLAVDIDRQLQSLAETE